MVALFSGDRPSIAITCPLPNRWCSTFCPTAICDGSAASKSAADCTGTAVVNLRNPCGTPPPLEAGLAGVADDLLGPLPKRDPAGLLPKLRGDC